MKSNNKLININIIPINNVNLKNKRSKNRNSINKNNKNTIDELISQNYNIESNSSSTCPLWVNNSQNNFNDEELNSLDYEIALIHDKRSYFQYYCSLLKKKQIILFTFMLSNDYNLFTLKLSFFLLSSSLFFSINGFFFSDDTMHKVHEDNGDFNLLVQIPQIFYSTIVSSFINVILKWLSLSENDILKIRKEKNLNSAIKKSKSIEKNIIKKFIIFFIVSIILLLFFWYFISCFCAVYVNTQIILLEDTLFSFGLSMVYPFGINLLPGLFRLPALRAKNKDKKCIYKISELISIF